MKRLVLLLCTLLATGLVSAQNNWISKDYDFVLYLIDNDMKADARSLVAQERWQPSDTLTYLLGWTEYNLRELESAVRRFEAVPPGSAFFEKALFYQVASRAHLGDYDTGVRLLDQYRGPHPEVRSLQRSGLALLQDDPEAYRKASEGFSYKDYALEAAERALDDIYRERYETRAKSPLLAAAASAVIPGLGKIYAGEVGEGVSSMLVIGALGAITAEHWKKDGLKDWKTIVPGLVCAVLYIGNIYGSYMSVSIHNLHLKDAQNTAVLYHIHIPLRTVFK